MAARGARRASIDARTPHLRETPHLLQEQPLTIDERLRQEAMRGASPTQQQSDLVWQPTRERGLIRQPDGYGILKIHIFGGHDLAIRDTNGLSDPYCCIRVGHQKWVSKIMRKTLNPSWDAVATFHGHLDQFLAKPAVLKVMDWDFASFDDFMGRSELPLDP